jgi:hypothetical protein
MRRKEHRTVINKMGPWARDRFSVCEVIVVGDVGVNNNNNNNNNSNNNNIFIHFYQGALTTAVTAM